MIRTYGTRRQIPILLTLSFFFAAIAAQAQRFTLEQVMSAPFNSGLTASPDGTRLLWTANEQGHRNLWVAEARAGAFSAHRVTSYDADDGLEISGARWTPDSKQIVYGFE